ncbi:hypothetical protein AGMMS49957_01750 [Synergistales bacterium]|nr:hypothetical protein AGMMS49957_01750 [Synergistales bacterium]
MGKEEKIQKILDSWQGENRLKTDSWDNVRSVLDYYGFTYEKKTDWVCSHPELRALAIRHGSRDILQAAKLNPLGQLTVAVQHGKNTKTGMVLRCYLNYILKSVRLLRLIRESKNGENTDE